MNRRALILAGACALLPRAALARPEDVAYAITQDFGRITPQDGRITLDLPGHSDAGTSVPLTLSVDSPMTADDYPAEVRLYGSGNPRPRIATVRFTPLCGVATFSTRIRLNGAQDVVAVMRTSRGEVWRASRRVSVTFGACAAAGDSDGLAADWVPQIRVAVPDLVTRGSQADIRTIITHPMETGLRLNSGNQYVPLRIVNRFTCHLNGVQAFEVRPEPAIATNPYLAFQLRADQSGEVALEWEETGGAIYREVASLLVA